MAGVEIVGHGGAGDFYPENSRLSVEAALQIGVDRIEVDILRSSDGDLVLVHDERLHVGDHLRPVRAMTTADISAVLDGLLTLDGFLDLVGLDQPLMLDLKAPGYEASLIDALRNRLADRDLIISSTYAPSLLAIKRAFPMVRVGLSTGHIATGFSSPTLRGLASAKLRVLTPIPAITIARAIGATELMVQHRVLTRGFVDRAHSAGLRVYAWTVNRPDHIDRVLDDGVDGVISNRPDRARERVALRR